MNPKNIALSPAAQDLGLGDALAMQVANETEEARKRRMLAMQQQALKPLGTAAQELFGDAGVGY